MPLLLTSTGYGYLMVDHQMGLTSKICYQFNDATTTATNVGNTVNYLGPTGNYEYLVRWNFEIQTNFTKADNTDYSMEIARVKSITVN